MLLISLKKIYLSPPVVRHAHFANLKQFLPPPKAQGHFTHISFPASESYIHGTARGLSRNIWERLNCEPVRQQAHSQQRDRSVLSAAGDNGER